MDSYRKELNLQSTILSFREVDEYCVFTETDDKKYMDGFVIDTENGEILFGIDSYYRCCEGIWYKHSIVETDIKGPILCETVENDEFTDTFRLYLQFPSGDTFTLNNNHNWYYAHNCYLLFNGEKVVDDMLEDETRMEMMTLFNLL